MANEVIEVFLDKVYEFRSGLSKPASEFGSGYDFLTFKDVFYNYFIPEELTELVNSSERERESCSILRGDVFLTRTSETMEDLGMSCVALKDYPDATFNGFTKRLRPNSSIEVIPEYATYYFRSPRFRRDVTSMSTLSTRASLNNEMLGRLKIVLPEPTVQKWIGATLKCLDDKIHLNKQINQTLESIAQTIFKSWFVDFDPVRAKMEGSEPEGMDAETAALFPDKLVGSELGMIPEGWSMSTVGDEFEITMGQSPPGSSYNEAGDGVAFFQGRRDFGDRYPSERVYCTEPKRYAKQGDTLLSVRAPVGDINKAAVECCIGRGLAALRHCSGNEAYTYYLCWNLASQLETYNTEGTVFGAINQKSLKQLNIIKPNEAVLDKFVELVDPVDQLIKYNWEEQNTLTEIRDTLLPKLISGEIQIPDEKSGSY